MDLSEDPEIAAEAMVEYMYNLDYDVCFSLSKTPTLGAHVEVAIIADKASRAIEAIPELYQIATKKVDRCLNDDYVDNEELTEAAEVAYNAPGPTAEIRGYIAQAACRKPNVFFIRQAEDSPFSKLMEKQPMLSKDVALAAVASAPIPRQQRPCPRCGEGMPMSIPAGSVRRCVQCRFAFGG
ncbi:hypothetical protein AC578_10255 [Pseudocercospora eumusae]|uniref:Uncharacterized protein n=1 Tax=Pseudocercospora eumusae TaxID=321146 RepID=A0A139HYM8_9PEZI|nr:hypothetical protein AC578_10255 [Pseudocercospora eumusae]